MSNEPIEPTVRGTVDPEELAAFVNERIALSEDVLTPDDVRAIVEESDGGQNEIDYDRLADEVGERLEGNGISEAHAREIISAELNPPLTALDNRINQLEAEQDEDDGGVGSDTEAAIERELQNVRLISRPKHRAQIPTGTPSGNYHPYGDWGQIVTVHDDVEWRSATIDAQSSGVTKLVVYEMDYRAGKRYDLGDVHATVEVNHGAGVQRINPEIVLPEGQYFLTRDAEQVVPMRRGEIDVDWKEFNARHNIPLTAECSWRAHANYQPGTDGYQKYRDNDWHRRFYYFGDCEFAFNTDTDGAKPTVASDAGDQEGGG